MTFPFQSLPENLAAFCALLRRDHRFLIGPRELQDAAHALELTALEDERAVRDTLRPVLSASLDDVKAFDAAFDRFFHRQRGGPPQHHGLASPKPADAGRGSAGVSAEASDRGGAVRADEAFAGESDVRLFGVSGEIDESAAGLLRASSSPVDAEGGPLDLGPPDRAWREAAAILVTRVRAGLSRRWRPSLRGQRFDLRRTLRRSLASAGDALVPHWRARRRRRPRFVLVIDGSRSMSGHVESALRTAVALSSVAADTETFAFSTALCRVTRDVRRAAGGESRRLRLHHAWGGGTAIGACLNELVRGFGERLIGRDTVVVIASDGLDVGSAALLRDAMACISRRSAAIVWLNPLLDTPGYEPTALGMSTARRYVAVLASAKSPPDLAALSRAIRVR